MPFIPDKGFVLSAAQEALRQAICKTAREVQAAMFNARALPMPKVSEDAIIGVLVQPAHTLETLSIPERSYVVRYAPNYGVTCQRLCTSNGSAWEIAACVRDDTRWEPRNEEAAPEV